MRTLALLFFVSAAAFAQCAVGGTAVNSVSGAPIERAHIGITAPGDMLFADSDATGKWTFEHVPCGNVSVLASRPGYLPKAVTATSPAHDLKVALVPQAVLSGHVLDEQGDPMAGAQVSLMTSRVINGVRGTQPTTSTVTNDLGEYRFYGLAAGKYSVCANAGVGVIYSGGRSYGEKCYPGGLPMDVAAGYEGRIDLTLASVVTVQVSGVVSGSESAQIMLVSRDQFARVSAGLSAQARENGTFAIKRVPAGSYTAFATSGRMSTSTPVVVGSTDIDSLQLHIEPGAKVTGTVKPALTGVGVQLVRDLVIDGVSFSQAAEWNSSGTAFTLSDIPSGNYRVQLTGPNPPFYVKSVTLEGRDISNSTFLIAPGVGNIEVILGDDSGAVEGDVSEPAWVLLQKDGVASRNTRTDANGHFKIDNVPPGEYKVYAWDDNTNVEYANPEWMRQNAKGSDVSVSPGQTAQVKLTRQTEPPI